MTTTTPGQGAPDHEDIDPDAVVLELMMTPEGKVDPYPRYALLHRHAPAFRSAIDALVLSRYDDCNHVLRDPRFGKSDDERGPTVDLTEEQMAKIAELGDSLRSMLGMNPPDHTRLRSLVSKAFTPRTVEAMRPHIERLTDELLDGMGEGEVDVMAELAFPLPATVIGELLGVPVEDRPEFQALVRATTKALELTMTSEEIDAALAATREMRSYFVDLAAERRRAPADDLLTKLIAAEDEGDRLTEDELIATAILLFAAGFETTTNLIGNGLLALLRHPDQLARLRDDPSLMRSAVEELLRWDSPVQIDGRTAFGEVEVAGHTVAEGELVVTLLGGANHDPTHWTDPRVLDLGRDEGAPMSFGAGIHYCLGAALARVEGQVVFGRLLDRFAGMDLCREVSYRDSLVLRGLVDLPVAFTRA